jgi:hypothetical protein
VSSSLADELLRLYTARVYPVLAVNDPIYQQSLVKAGLGWTPSDINLDHHRSSFEQEMKLQAWLAASRIEDARSLDSRTIKIALLEGPTTIYRVSQKGKGNPPGIWWFSEKLAKHCREEAGPDPQKRLAWLRNVLAVCFNWSSFDQIQRLPLRPHEKIPAVFGRGLAMPYYKAEPYIDRKTGEHVVNLPVDYWQRKGQMLIGGELQIVLPWIPVRRIATTPSL